MDPISYIWPLRDQDEYDHHALVRALKIYEKPFFLLVFFLHMQSQPAVGGGCIWAVKQLSPPTVG